LTFGGGWGSSSSDPAPYKHNNTSLWFGTDLDPVGFGPEQIHQRVEELLAVLLPIAAPARVGILHHPQQGAGLNLTGEEGRRVEVEEGGGMSEWEDLRCRQPHRSRTCDPSANTDHQTIRAAEQPVDPPRKEGRKKEKRKKKERKKKERKRERKRERERERERGRER
jgi:hypothetical protein